MDKTQRLGISIEWNTVAPRNGKQDGARVRDVIDVVIDRLQFAQDKAPSDEHAEVIRLLHEARNIHVKRTDEADRWAGSFEWALLGR